MGPHKQSQIIPNTRNLPRWSKAIRVWAAQIRIINVVMDQADQR